MNGVWDDDERSENGATRRRVEALLVRKLPDAHHERVLLLRMAECGDLRDKLDLEGPKTTVARRLTVQLLDDSGGAGRACLTSLIRQLCEDNAADAEWCADAREVLERIRVYRPRAVKVTAHGEALGPAELRARVRSTVQGDLPAAQVTPQAMDGEAEEPAGSFEEYVGKCLLDAERQPAVDGRFVALSLLIDQRRDGRAVGPERFEVQSRKYRALKAALDDNPDCELVLVGPPGAGKTTLSARLRLELSRAAVGDRAAPLPFMVHLGGYGQDERGRVLDPHAWLAEQWRAVMPSVPFDQALARRPFVLLLDALNEMPRMVDATLSERIGVWRDWLETFHQATGGRHRVIFTCRIRDLSASLSSRSRSVRLLEIDALDDDQVGRFLDEHAEGWAPQIRAQLKADPPLADLYRTPLSLTLLIDLLSVCGRVPTSRSALFTGHVCYALRREVERPNPRFAAGGLLSIHDVTHILQRPFDLDEPHALPDDGPLFDALAQLASAMQRRSLEGERTHVVLSTKRARQLFDTLPVDRGVGFDDLVGAGVDLGLLTSSAGKLAFTRQPHQEYFAARAWAEVPDYALVETPWTADERDLEGRVARLLEDEPLPPPPTTGWEETALLGAEMAEDDAVIDGLAAVHPALAGRAAARRPNARQKAPLRTALLRRSQDPEVDLRERVAAGEALGELGHPEFEPREGPHGRYLMPPMVDVPGGRFTMGAKSRWADEQPVHARSVAGFRLGKYPVTRAELACFVDAGGYEDPQWWTSPGARRWFDGDGVGEGRREVLRRNRAAFQKDPDQLNDDRFTPPARKFWRERLAESDPAFEAWLDRAVERGKQTGPAWWTDRRYQGATMPAVGVCLYEVEAYLQWFTVQSGIQARLPTEAEWERAARGLEPSGRFPWRQEILDPLRHANVYESHIRGLTPVGVFPEGRSREGCFDLSGLVWEWTSSVWTASHAAGAESDEGRRVVRGGSWYDPLDYARAASRGRSPLDDRANYQGFRLCFPAPQSEG